jgi:predicted phage tail component-like protein
MSYFIFNNIRSDDMHLYIEHLPPIIKPPERYDLIKTSGSSIVRINEQGYDIYEKTVAIGFNEQNIESVMNWLRGQGQLIFSNELDKYYDVYIPNQIDYEKALRFRKANIVFLTQPYKHATGEEETTSRIVINQGNTECLPLMTIYGSGAVDILINGVKACSVTISEYVTLDSEEQDAYKGSVLQNRVMVGEFPKLSPGENTLTFAGNVTNVKTLVRSRWL